jgi:hypothetical protein
MLEALGNYRPLLLACFAVGGLVAVVSSVAPNRQLFFWGVYVAHVALMFFLLTESFGPISKTRTTFSRVIARIFLVLAAVIVVGTTISLGIGGNRAFV